MTSICDKKTKNYKNYQITKKYWKNFQGLKVSKNSGSIYEDRLVSSGSVRKTCLAEA